MCLSGEAGVSLQLLFSMRYSAAGKCIAQAAASWCHNVGLCSKVLIVLLRGQAEIFPLPPVRSAPSPDSREAGVGLYLSMRMCFFHLP